LRRLTKVRQDSDDSHCECHNNEGFAELMSIEINGPQGRPAVEIADNNRKTQAKSASDAASPRPTKGSGGPGETLSLTNEASQLQALEDHIAALPVVDTQRVQEIQRSLATGSFQVDPAKVAENMLQFEAGLANDHDGDE
jgi:negative regulator of flagellin synthesis FlgM